MSEHILKEAILKYTGETDPGMERLYGGDINQVVLIKGRRGKAVLKTNNHPLQGMFKAEAKGLETLSQCEAFCVPQVLAVDEGFLLMTYIEPGSKNKASADTLGRALGSLHNIKSKCFGFSHDNYIGSLPQSNRRHENSVDFYREERLLPQFESAINKGYKIRDTDLFLNRLQELIPEEPASLVHGDLWSGNYMVSAKGEPCLIDPAVSYSSRETDLAMMALFGGFPKNYVAAYEEVTPLVPGWQDRVSLWQLYYILVHLNLFGSGYYSRVIQIVKRYL